MAVDEAGDDASAESADAEDTAPVTAVDEHAGPAAIFFHACAGVSADPIEATLDLGGVELRVAETLPHAADVECVGGDVELQATVHVGAELEFGARGAGWIERVGEAVTAGGCGGGRELGESLGDGF